MLTNLDCNTANCPPEKSRMRYFDSGGLYLEVSKNGSKRWFWKYRINQKEKRMALGVYPQVSLKKARLDRDKARALHSEGADPVLRRQAERSLNAIADEHNFEPVARAWHEKQRHTWSKKHADRILREFERDFFPFLGAKDMHEIEAPELLETLLKVENRGAVETAHRELRNIARVWRFWLPTSNKGRNMTEGLQERLSPFTNNVMPAITTPKEFGALLRAMRVYHGGVIVKTALLISPILYQRPENIRMMEWSELDFEQNLWTIPSIKMKRRKQEKLTGEDHIVPLPRQAIELIQSIKPLTGEKRYVFTNERSAAKPISENSGRSALYSIGYGKKQAWHGFRASARTMLVDELGFDPMPIEANLAHVVKDPNGRSYNRAKHLKKRIEMAQVWADYLDRLEQSI